MVKEVEFLANGKIEIEIEPSPACEAGKAAFSLWIPLWICVFVCPSLFYYSVTFLVVLHKIANIFKNLAEGTYIYHNVSYTSRDEYFDAFIE